MLELNVTIPEFMNPNLASILRKKCIGHSNEFIPYNEETRTIILYFDSGSKMNSLIAYINEEYPEVIINYPNHPSLSRLLY